MSKPIESDRTLDCIGLYCPIPVLQTRKEVDNMEVGQILELITDDPAAEEDIKYWAKTSGQQLLEIIKEGKNLRFFIKKVGR